MMPRNPILRENNDAAISTSPNLISKQPPTTPNPSHRKLKSSKENAPPSQKSDPNSMTSSPSTTKVKSPLPPRPPLKRKLNVDSAVPENCAVSSLDSGVKVTVRVRPPNKYEDDGGSIVENITSNSLSVSGQAFTFDSIANIQANQIDIFELIGAPLIENCLAGFNSSVFAYGQTGSGKTYTIWGASNSLLDGDQQGLAPRVFHRLFERIDEEQVKQAQNQLVYMCRCSFLEIYNEQITDLLEPSQKNLQIREDITTGVYVENLREECVSSMKDVSQLLMKGLSNRRTSATYLNAESSRSHSVFTCIVESRSKSVTDGLSRLKMSRINFVDLAGSERQKQTGAAGERLKEAGNINRSLSQLGNLINILAEISQTGKQRHIPYRDSKLTFLLQESLGGNAKLAMICAISPDQSCKSETLSTLRFAQRAKAIKNKAIINEEMHDDVNVLREVIRELRDELYRMKSNHNETGQDGAYATGWSARRSLNLLRFSLNRPMALPCPGNDTDDEMEIVDTKNGMPVMQSSEVTDVNMEDVTCESEDKQNNNTPEKSTDCIENDAVFILKSPTPSLSPRANNSRKSLGSPYASISKKPCNSICMDSLSNNKHGFKSTENLAASIHHGLEIILSQRALRQSSFRLSCMAADIKTVIPVAKVDVGFQTRFHEDESSNKYIKLLCNKCKRENIQHELITDDDQNMQLAPVTESPSEDKCKKQVPRAVEKVLAGAIRREMALEEICNKQNAEIMQLNRLVQQYKHERECNAVIGRTREDKIARLESLMNGVLPTEEFMEDELLSLTHEHKILQEQYDNHPDVLRTKIELKRIQEDLERYQNFFDLGERDVLLEEIQALRAQLQFYLVSSDKTLIRQPSLLKQQPSSCGDTQEKFEQERIQWTETESKWISLVEELRLELESNRSCIQTQKQELDMEKRCSEELKEAMQMAMEGHARMLENYADLEEKHIQLLARHRKIQDGIGDVKKAALKAGVRGAESKFINALAAEISALKVEREKERRYFRNENKGLQSQLRDTAEAVQAAGELLVRLKEAEEAVATAEKRAMLAEQETENSYKEFDKLKILLEAIHMPKEELGADESRETRGGDQQWHEEFAPSYDVAEEPSSWFSGYDRCNI